MDPAITSAIHWFRRIYLDGIPVLLRQNDSAFLSFLCVVTAVDALAGYRYTEPAAGKRFSSFVRDYFPPEYVPHADNLWQFRCRILHNFSPAYFSLVHSQPAVHLEMSAIGDTALNDESFFSHLSVAAEKFFDELQQNISLQANMLSRLQNPASGGSIYVA